MTEAILIVTGMALMAALIWLKRRFASFPVQQLEDYADTAPHFDLKKHLNGPMICDGVIYGPMGRVTSRFSGDFETTWDGDHGVMAERFHYDNGGVQDREWRLTLGEDGAIRAEADDIIGVGEGRQMAACVRLRYRIKLDEDAGGHVLDAIDWMYLTPNGTIVNRSQFRKYGIKVAELVATMHKKDS